MNNNSYTAQDRGGKNNYEHYYTGMDTTMQQKLAFLGAHLLLDPNSRIADMGCGSGTGAYQLALLNPQINVIGVDINPESINFAKEHYKLPNLEFKIGDVSEPIFAQDPLDGILSSSTLHHIYTFNGYSINAVRQALASHLACLKNGGIFVLRDFVRPASEECIIIELYNNDDAELLSKFAQTARPLDERCGSGFFMEELGSHKKRSRRFRLPYKWAVEFVLRKDYREDWDVELLEEYCYFSPQQFSEEIRKAGGRLLCANPYYNPWIIANRFVNKFNFFDETGARLDWPATNFVAVAQKVETNDSLCFKERCPASKKSSFLQKSSFKMSDKGKDIVYDVIRRPFPVCDVLPWRIHEGRLRIVARHGYPRPITTAMPRGPVMIDNAQWGGYLIEPLTAMLNKKSKNENIADVLTQRAGINAKDILSIKSGPHFFPSPGGIDEVIFSNFVEIASPVKETFIPADISGFSTAGSVREFDAQNLLRAAQVGVLSEARLELGIHFLMTQLGLVKEAYFGEKPVIPNNNHKGKLKLKNLEQLLMLPPQSPYIKTKKSADYMRLVRSVFADQTIQNDEPLTLAEQELEFAIPNHSSVNTILAVPICAIPEIHVGLETRMLPVPQKQEHNARLLTLPAWRLEFGIKTIEDAKTKIAAHFKVDKNTISPLGAPYFPSAGITPERVYPFVVPVNINKNLPYDFVPLDEIKEKLFTMTDGHLLIAIARLLHALEK
ncbi:MAG: class I SAM-dependent methyltransferase [Alphaproteobacteria bacterium]